MIFEAKKCCDILQQVSKYDHDYIKFAFIKIGNYAKSKAECVEYN